MISNAKYVLDGAGQVFIFESKDNYKHVENIPRIKSLTQILTRGRYNDVKVMPDAIGITDDGGIIKFDRKEKYDVVYFEKSVKSIVSADSGNYILFDDKTLWSYDFESLKLENISSGEVEHVNIALSETGNIDNYHTEITLFVIKENGQCKILKKEWVDDIKVDLNEIVMVRPSVILLTNGIVYQYYRDDCHKHGKFVHASLRHDDIIDIVQHFNLVSKPKLCYIRSNKSLYFDGYEVTKNEISKLRIEKFIWGVNNEIRLENCSQTKFISLGTYYCDFHIYFSDESGKLFCLDANMVCKHIDVPFNMTYVHRFMWTKSSNYY